MNDMLKTCHCHIDDLIHYNFTGGFDIHRRDRFDCICTALAGKLDGKVTHSALCAVDEKPIDLASIDCV
jgi:hypothetical protein